MGILKWTLEREHLVRRSFHLEVRRLVGREFVGFAINY